jgi:hypothetical protein
MHDFRLGPPVDIGEYAGLLLEGKPLHPGNCEDGVYGCRKCNQRFRLLSEEQRAKLRDPENPKWRAEPNPTDTCDWCKKTVPIRDIQGLRPWDEPGCYYEVCKDCKDKHDRELHNECDRDVYDEYEHDDYGW